MQVWYEKFGPIKSDVNDLVQKYPSDAGYDFQVFGIEETSGKTDHISRILHPGESFLIIPGKTYKIFCGIRLCIPDGYYGLFVPRSSMRRRGLVVLSIWDAGFTGWVSPFITTVIPFSIVRGERLIQLIIQPLARLPLHEIDFSQIPETDRGIQGDGSTGRL